MYSPLGGATLSVAAAFSCAAAAVCALLYCRKGDSMILALLMLILLGLMTGFSAKISELSGFSSVSFIPQILRESSTKALEALLGAIDRLEVTDTQVKELAKALLTGHREGLSLQTIVSFRAAGASHILSLSGLHIGIIYIIMQRSLSWLGRSQSAMVFRSLLIISASGFYVLMTGASASVVRAFLFITINEFSRLQPGRRRRPIAVLCCALMLQLLAYPLVIRSLGFQLSYLAMLGIVLLFPELDSWYVPRILQQENQDLGHPLESGITHLSRAKKRKNHQKFSRWPAIARKRIWSAAAISISCQIFTAPLVLIRFKTFPQYFLLSNLIAVPLTEAFVIAIIVSLVMQTLAPNITLSAEITEQLGTYLIRFLEIVASL